MERQDKKDYCSKKLQELQTKYVEMQERKTLLGDLKNAKKLAETSADLFFIDVFIDDLNHKISTLEVENDLLRIRVKDLERKK